MVDEERHARDAFSLAAAYGGPALGPAASAAPDGPPPSVDALAVETFRDGCVGETLAARVASATLRVCTLLAVREVLARVAADERQHAELAWDILAWLWPRTSAEARAAIAAEAPAARGRTQDRRDAGWLARHGWLDGAAEDDVTQAAWADEILPRRAALLGRCAQAAVQAQTMRTP
jgi:hypothetical protein